MLYITNTFRDARLFKVLKIFVPVIVLAITIFAAVSASAFTLEQVVVRESDVKDIAEATSGRPGWYKQTVGSGSFTTNAVHPYSIAGSGELKVSDSTSYVEVGLYNTLPSLRFDEITSIGYATMQTVNSAQSTALQLGIDLDKTDADTSWQGRMVFEPYLNTSLVNEQLKDGEWQAWSTFKPTANWWMTWSSSATAVHGINPCPQSNPCMLTEIKALFPNAGLNPSFGNPLILKAGSGWDSFTGYFDAPNVATTSRSQYWEFEPNEAPVTQPTSKSQCFKDGWMTFGATFKNQGQCVASLNDKN